MCTVQLCHDLQAGILHMLSYYEQYVLVHPALTAADLLQLWSWLRPLDEPIVSNITLLALAKAQQQSNALPEQVAASFRDRYQFLSEPGALAVEVTVSSHFLHCA